MTLDLKINWRPEIGKKVDAFFNNPGYKAYLDNAVSFNRKLNEERKMRIPYVDSQTGFAQRPYNKERFKRERMPGQKFGQIYSYPQRIWRKKKYQYLEHFMKEPEIQTPFEPESELHTISQIENPAAEKPVVTSASTNSTTTIVTESVDPESVTNDDIPTVVNGDASLLKTEEEKFSKTEESSIIASTKASTTTTNSTTTITETTTNNATTTTTTKTKAKTEREWVFYDDDEAFLDEDMEPEIKDSSGDSDFGESYGSKKKKKSKGGRGRGSRGGRGSRSKGRK